MGREEFTALLGAGTEYNGQLTFTGTVRVDGRFSGNITSEGKLILGKEAKVEGTITVGELVVHGYLQGDVRVTRRTILHQTAQIFGTISTALLVMEEGAILQGELQMKKIEKQNKTKNPLNALPQKEGAVAILSGEAIQ